MATDWTPSTPALTAETFDSTVQQHRCVAIHFWASRNRYDRELDERMAPLREEFAGQVEFRSVNVDDSELLVVTTTAPVLNVPALGIWRRGVRERVFIGLRPLNAWRHILRDATRPVGVPPSGISSCGVQAAHAFELYQAVRLVTDLPEAGLTRGAPGVVVGLNVDDPAHVEVDFHVEDGTEHGRYAQRIVGVDQLEVDHSS